jgi:hypothetical protein
MADRHREKEDRGAPARERRDAEGQFVRAKHGRRNDGVDSAAPSVITGSKDATFDTDPDGKPIGAAKKKT